MNWTDYHQEVLLMFIRDDLDPPFCFIFGKLFLHQAKEDKNSCINLTLLLSGQLDFITELPLIRSLSHDHKTNAAWCGRSFLLPAFM